MDKDQAEKILEIRNLAKLRTEANRQNYEGKIKKCDTIIQLLDRAHWEITKSEVVLVWLEAETTNFDSIIEYSSVGTTAKYIAGSINSVNLVVAYTPTDESGMHKFSIIGYNGAHQYYSDIMSKLHIAESNRDKSKGWYSSWPGSSIDNQASGLEPEIVLQIIRDVL